MPNKKVSVSSLRFSAIHSKEKKVKKHDCTLTISDFLFLLSRQSDSGKYALVLYKDC